MNLIEATVAALRAVADEQCASRMRGETYIKPTAFALDWARGQELATLRCGDRACLSCCGVFAGAIARTMSISDAAARYRLKKAEAAGLVLAAPTTGGCTRWWPVGMAEQLLALYAPKAVHCRVCGCTDSQACPGGCCWVEPDLCSACAKAPMPFGAP